MVSCQRGFEFLVIAARLPAARLPAARLTAALLITALGQASAADAVSTDSPPADWDMTVLVQRSAGALGEIVPGDVLRIAVDIVSPRYHQVQSARYLGHPQLSVIAHEQDPVTLTAAGYRQRLRWIVQPLTAGTLELRDGPGWKVAVVNPVAAPGDASSIEQTTIIALPDHRISVAAVAHAQLPPGLLPPSQLQPLPLPSPLRHLPDHNPKGLIAAVLVAVGCIGLLWLARRRDDWQRQQLSRASGGQPS